MSTSYGAPIELFSVDPASGVKLNDVLAISNQYAAKNSNFKFSSNNPRNDIYTNLPNKNVYDLTSGYSKYQDGSIGHH